jgi:hypothetical protein
MSRPQDVQVVRLEPKTVDEACVARLADEIARRVAAQTGERARDLTPPTDRSLDIVIDFSTAEELTPRALAALIELGGAVPGLGLVGLSRRATLMAIQVGLADRFQIFAALEPHRPAREPIPARAPEGALRRSAGPDRRLRAVIHERPECPGVGALDVAGRPLLIRQLQFLRSLGVGAVYIEICEGAELGSRADPRASSALERAERLLGHDPLTSDVRVIPSARPLGSTELARRAGLGPDELFLALPADVAAQGKLDLQVDAPTRYELPAPVGLGADRVTLELRTRRAPADQAPIMAGDGWGYSLRNHDQAHALGCCALEGRAPGLLVHAAEVRPGVWLARGARVSSDAQLVGPVLIGPDARVMAEAKVGPRALLGQGTVVERNAVVSETSVAPHTIVGEGARIRGAHASEHGLVSFADGSLIPVDDALTLCGRGQVGTALSSRLLALLLLVLLATPWLCGLGVRRLLGRPSVRALKTRRGRIHVGASGLGVVDLLPALFDVVMGHRDLIGINDHRALEEACRGGAEPPRSGALDVSTALAPGASPQTLLRMWRWYQAHKSAALDRALWRQRAVPPPQEP